MRLLLLGTLLVVALSACGADATDTAGSAAPTAAGSTASPDNALAKAAEELARSSTDIPTEVPPVPQESSADPAMTIAADPSRYVVPTPVDETSDDCATIWRAGRTLPSPYDGCMDATGLVTPEERDAGGGLAYDYRGLCAREGAVIRRC
ncbi:hypothetical protein [Nocardioides jiangxiensis]|uniref:Lipoprotein n=1 Tax=Nocardioides jiangxiensis TaxID=3064524 RepID=A0ABT9B4J2_9ACTN|nr:hypothetical protein [Nocardioides sp. WY-20]MDO7868517.1 hypothetical protein [Nocardioides sp. WY-20]